MESSLNSEVPLAASFPLPFRVLALAGLGILGWATNLHGLETLGVDPVVALELRPDPRQSPHWLETSETRDHTRKIYHPVYHVFVAYTMCCMLSWTIYRYLTYENLLMVDAFGYIPGVTAVFMALILVCPFNVFHKTERDRFLRATHRCLFPRTTSPIYFSDIVFADVFTSFAKVLGDFALSILMLLPGNSLLDPPSQDGWLKWVIPAIMSFPYFVRFRQCLVEYSQSNNQSFRPLYNAIKYATSFPVIFLSVAQRIAVSELAKEKGDAITEQPWHGEHSLFRLWLLAAVVNSLYSYWWDITNDWGFELLKPTPTLQVQSRPPPPRHLILPALRSTESLQPHPAGTRNNNDSHHKLYPYGLRPRLLYPLPLYPLVVFLNLILRLTWSIKLSSHLHSTADRGVAVFWLEVAEIFRRWMWVFIRVEWEVVKDASGERVENGIVGDPDYELIPVVSEDT